MNKLFIGTLIISASALQGAPKAEVSLSGQFVARQACPALQSIQKETNPGGIVTEVNRSYPLIAKNKPDASHYLIEIDGANPSHRWVSVGCGEQFSADNSSTDKATTTANGDGGATGGTKVTTAPDYILAVSWEPAFCDEHRKNAECEIETRTAFGATHFTLHGLWPEPRGKAYCNVSETLKELDKQHDWESLPAIVLAPDTRRSLDEVMPGTKSDLERHEWIEHGTCSNGETADVYFSHAIALITQLNASKARDLFASNIGGEIATVDIKDAFNQTFGDGAGDRVRVSCKRDKGRNLIVELTIGLAGPIGDNPSLGALIANANPTDSGCPKGFVENVAN
jgi:ribonuclease T2